MVDTATRTRCEGVPKRVRGRIRFSGRGRAVQRDGCPFCFRLSLSSPPLRALCHDPRNRHTLQEVRESCPSSPHLAR